MTNEENEIRLLKIQLLDKKLKKAEQLINQIQETLVPENKIEHQFIFDVWRFNVMFYLSKDLAVYGIEKEFIDVVNRKFSKESVNAGIRLLSMVCSYFEHKIANQK